MHSQSYLRFYHGGRLLTFACNSVHTRLLSTSTSTSSSSSRPNLMDPFSEPNKKTVQSKLDTVKPVRNNWIAGGTTAAAAVLVPLCICDGEPCILYTLRSSKLVQHRGEVSFPGGKVDASDTDVIHTAVREAEEEIGLDPTSSVDMWGQLSPLPSRDGKMAITPIICNIGSVDIHSLVPNKDEVEQVFTEKLDTLCDSARLGFTQYRSAGGYTLPVFHGMNHRIWGLTAIITHQLLGILAPTHYRHKLKFILPLLKVRR